MKNNARNPMKAIKSVKLNATKTATKALTTKTPEAVRAPRRSANATPATTATASTPPAARLTAPRRKITSDLIAQRAYIIWEQQGCPQGHDVANWLLAERQLQQEHSFTA
jgi:hypothetical protein